MEKYSKFNDPLYGINPFIQPKLKMGPIWKLFIWIPIYILSLIFPIFKRCLFNIKRDIKINNPQVIICNSVSSYDIFILKWYFNIKNSYNLQDYKGNFSKPCCIFVEGCTTNNKSILNYSCRLKIDAVCFIRYENVYCYGSYIKYLMCMLSNSNKVEIIARESNCTKDLVNISGLKQVVFTYKDKEEFNRLLK